MLLRVLNPVEQHDYRRLVGRGARLWGEVWFWAVVAAVGLRLFISLPNVFWLRVGHWSLLLGGYVAFLATPYLMHQLVSRRVREGSLEIERTIPLHARELLLGKLRVCALVILTWIWPLLVVGIISDPTLSITGPRIAGAFLQPADAMSPWPLLVLAVAWYVALWALFATMCLRLAIAGTPMIGLIGQYVFWLGVILVGMSWIDAKYNIVRPEGVPGHPTLVLSIVLVLAALAYLMFASARRRLVAGV